jgi:hypothetical protein
LESSFVASLFFLPLHEYLHNFRWASLRPAVEENPDASLGSIMKRMALDGLHHIWLLNKGSRKPAGIVTLTDILRVVCLYIAPGAFIVLSFLHDSQFLQNDSRGQIAFSFPSIFPYRSFDCVHVPTRTRALRGGKRGG